MGFVFRRRKRVTPTTSVSVTPHGASVSKRAGRVPPGVRAGSGVGADRPRDLVQVQAVIDRPTPEGLEGHLARIKAIEEAGGHLHTWPGGLDLLAECATCGKTIDQFGLEALPE